MKPITSQTFLIQNLLMALAIMLAVVGIIFSAKIINVISSPFGSITEGDVQVSLYLGIVPLPFLTHFLGFIFIYLMFELYGFKPAFYTSISQAVAALMGLAVLFLIANFTLDVENSKYDEILSGLLIYNKKNVLVLILSFMAGNGVTVFMASVLKKLMRNYFMFIRFPISAVLGFSVCVALYVYLNGFETQASRSMLIYAITPALQFLALIMVAVIPLYLLRFVLGIFRGWSKSEDVAPPTPQSLFKAAETSEICESQSEISEKLVENS